MPFLGILSLMGAEKTKSVGGVGGSGGYLSHLAEGWWNSGTTEFC